jgi:hypothetical protein
MAEAVTSLSYQGNASSSDLTADGSTVTIGPLSVTIAGYDLTGSQAQCQLGRGEGSGGTPAGGTAAGSSDYGFVDTTYSLTAAQIQAGSLMGA